MPEKIKERLSKTDIASDYSKINFDGLSACSQEDNRKYKISTGELSVEMIRGLGYGRRN